MQTLDLDQAARSLAKDSLLRIRRGRGQTVMVLEGLAWVTQDGDPRDIFVGAGESFTLDCPQMTLVQALEDTRLIVLAPLRSAQVVRAASSAYPPNGYAPECAADDRKNAR